MKKKISVPLLDKNKLLIRDINTKFIEENKQIFILQYNKKISNSSIDTKKININDLFDSRNNLKNCQELYEKKDLLKK